MSSWHSVTRSLMISQNLFELSSENTTCSLGEYSNIKAPIMAKYMTEIVL